MVRWTGLLWCVVALGCTTAETIRADLPNEPGYLVLLSVDANGRFEQASELRELDADGSIPFAIGAEHTQLAFYSKTQLAAFDDALGGQSSGRLRLAEVCEPALPKPLWYADLEGVEPMSLDPFGAPVLTSDLLSTVCPDKDRSTVYFRGCGQERCLPEVSSRPGCGLEVDLQSCGLGTALVSIDSQGVGCAQFVSQPSCEPEILTETTPTGLPYRVERSKLFEAETFIHSRLRFDVLPKPVPAVLSSGYATDLLVLDDRAIVVAFEGTQRDACPIAVRPETRIFVLDHETMSTVTATSGPACLTRIVADPGGSGFIGTFAEGGVLHLGRFDSSGGLVQSAMLEGSGDRDSVVGVHVLDGRIVLVLALDSPNSLQHDNRIVVVDAQLDVISSFDLPMSAVSLSRAGADGQLLLASGADASLWVVDPATEQVVRKLEDESETASVGTLFEPLWHAASGRWLLPTVDPDRLLVFNEGGGARSALDPVQDGYPLTSITATHDSDLVLVSTLRLDETNEWKAVLRLFDPSEGRFLLGRETIGAGIVSRMMDDGSGRLWLLLPWAAEVVRLTPSTAESD